MYKLCFALLFLFLLLTHADVFCQTPPKDVYETIAQRVYRDQVDQVENIEALDREVRRNLETLDQQSGRWTDVDYLDHKRINVSWLPVLERMRKMTVAYTHPQSRFYEDATLWDAINKSLFYFSSRNPLPYCDNWYQQGITRPQKLALSLINMQYGKKALDGEVRKVVLAAACKDTAVTSNGRNNPMHRYNFGANKSEIALGWIYLSTLLKNQQMLETAVREAFAPLQLTTGEGIQHDFSYDMHYGYLYNGAYGLVFVHSLLKTANFVRQTAFNLSEDKLALFRTFVKEGIFGVMRGKTMDWNVMGRGVSRSGVLRKNLIGELDILQQIDTLGAPYYREVQQRMLRAEGLSPNKGPAHRHFWQTDFTVHTRPEYYFSIHAVSCRNHAQEIGNQENLQGYWGAQGTTNLMQSGQEFDDIFPLWNWAKLPGTTLPDTVPVQLDRAPGSGDRLGTSSFSGGVTDSLYGATAYVVDNDLGTSYKKAWFMFDNEIVCLGTGIHSFLPGIPLSTTLNQAILSNSTIQLKERGKAFCPVATKPYTYQGDSAEAFLIDSVGYVMLGKSKVKLHIEERKGTWGSIRGNSERGRGREEHKTIFQLEIAHGVTPSDADYAYMILPAVRDAATLERDMQQSPVRLITNSPDLQAVYHDSLHIGQAVFYKAHQLCKIADIEISTDAPCILMLKVEGRRKYNLFVSDPTQELANINITIRKGTQLQTLLVELPLSPYAGQTVRRQVSF